VNLEREVELGKVDDLVVELAEAFPPERTNDANRLQLEALLRNSASL
jgi:hypothetical protein